MIRPLAEEGNTDAQTTLGTMYAEGKSVRQDYAEALKWFRKAAESTRFPRLDSQLREGPHGTEQHCPWSRCVTWR